MLINISLSLLHQFQRNAHYSAQNAMTFYQIQNASAIIEDMTQNVKFNNKGSAFLEAVFFRAFSFGGFMLLCARSHTIICDGHMIHMIITRPQPHMP